MCHTTDFLPALPLINKPKDYKDHIFFQFVVFSALVASALSAPAGPPAPYHPAPHHDPYGKIPPRPFAYAYGVSDEYSGTNFDKKETQDANGRVNAIFWNLQNIFCFFFLGVVAGEYRVALPDGRTQIVTYHADHHNGYIADVKYEGHPVYPVHKPAPGYAPHPVKAHPVGPHHGPAHLAPF